MSRLIIKLILVILCTMGIGLAITLDPGYIFIKYNNFEYESSLWVSIGLIAAALLIIWLIITLIRIVLQAFGAVNPFSNDRKQRRGELGLRELAEGDWSAALKHLTSATKCQDTSLSYYLGAAQAANELKLYEKSDLFIEKACEQTPKAKIAIGLTYANLLMARQDYDRALSVVKELATAKPNHPLIIKLMYDIYIQQEDWESIKTILPALYKYKLLPKNILDQIEEHTWSTSLKQSYKNNANQPVLAIEQLRRAWDSMPAKAKEKYHLVEAYIKQLCALNGHKEAEHILQRAIDREYKSELVYLYGQVQGEDNTKQIAHAERWLKKHQDDAILLLTLGKLCQRVQLWGKAQEYLEKSIQINNNPEACLELANYLAEHGDAKQSNQLFQKGLQRLHHSVKTIQIEK